MDTRVPMAPRNNPVLVCNIPHVIDPSRNMHAHRWQTSGPGTSRLVTLRIKAVATRMDDSGEKPAVQNALG